MKIYLVGGAVRDKLLGLPVTEHDYVVVGATEAEMLKLGYQRVGKEFPVFLHPKTKDEYALARLERKTGPGYKGFAFDTSPEVTLEEDLLRRDLTINAMAETMEGEVIDPYHGQNDLQLKLLKHVSDAFAEDPVRILRVGRFLARYAHLGFKVAPETIALMRRMVEAGEVNALVAERVWKELERALLEKTPQAFFQVLAECGALPILFPDFTLDNAGIRALNAATNISNRAAIRFAALLFHYDHIKTFSTRYKVPNYFQALATLAHQNHQLLCDAKTFNAEQLLSLFYKLDIFRREERFLDLLTTCSAIHDQLDTKWLKAAADAARSFPVQNLLAKGLDGQALASALKAGRQEKIAEWLANSL